MLTHGANVNMKDENASTPLLCAVKGKRLNSVRVLLENGADENAQDMDGSTPLMVAADFRAAPASVHLLLEYGAEVNRQDKEGNTALYLAVQDCVSPSENREEGHAATEHIPWPP